MDGKCETERFDIFGHFLNCCCGDYVLVLRKDSNIIVGHFYNFLVTSR